MLSRREKSELIDLLDASSVDKKQEEQLNGAVVGAKEVLGG